MFSCFPKASAWLTFTLIFCGLTNGPSETLFNYFCFKCLTQLLVFSLRENLFAQDHI